MGSVYNQGQPTDWKWQAAGVFILIQKKLGRTKKDGVRNLFCIESTILSASRNKFRTPSVQKCIFFVSPTILFGCRKAIKG